MAYWVVIANRSFAEIFEIIGSGKQIKPVYRLEFPEGREKSFDILSDRPGRSFNSVGANRHALGTAVDPHAHEQQVFAKQIAEMLRKAREKNEFSELSIIAPPEFLGALRAVLSDHVIKTIKKEVRKDVPLDLSEHQRVEHIRKHLELSKPIYEPPTEVSQKP